MQSCKRGAKTFWATLTFVVGLPKLFKISCWGTKTFCQNLPGLKNLFNSSKISSALVPGIKNYYSLIILHADDNNFLFWHLYQIHTFNNNLKEEGLITSHLIWANLFMIKMLQLLCCNFLTIIEKLGKTCYMIKPLRYCKI